MSDWLRDLVAGMAQKVEPACEPAPAIDPDPCARLTVKAVSGGLPDAPVVKHAMKFKRNPACNHVGKCRHTPRHEDSYLPDHKATHGICMCPPVDVDAHYEYVEGMRSKGIAQKTKSIGADKGRAGHYDSSANLQGTRRERLTINDRLVIHTFLAWYNGWICTSPHCGELGFAQCSRCSPFRTMRDHSRMVVPHDPYIMLVTVLWAYTWM